MSDELLRTRLKQVKNPYDEHRRWSALIGDRFHLRSPAVRRVLAATIVIGGVAITSSGAYAAVVDEVLSTSEALGAVTERVLPNAEPRVVELTQAEADPFEQDEPSGSDGSDDGDADGAGRDPDGDAGDRRTEEDAGPRPRDPAPGDEEIPRASAPSIPSVDGRSLDPEWPEWQGPSDAEVTDDPDRQPPDGEQAESDQPDGELAEREQRGRPAWPQTPAVLVTEPVQDPDPVPTLAVPDVDVTMPAVVDERTGESGRHRRPDGGASAVPASRITGDLVPAETLLVAVPPAAERSAAYPVADVTMPVAPPPVVDDDPQLPDAAGADAPGLAVDFPAVAVEPVPGPDEPLALTPLPLPAPVDIDVDVPTAGTVRQDRRDGEIADAPADAPTVVPAATTEDSVDRPAARDVEPAVVGEPAVAAVPIAATRQDDLSVTGTGRHQRPDGGPAEGPSDVPGDDPVAVPEEPSWVAGSGGRHCLPEATDPVAPEAVDPGPEPAPEQADEPAPASVIDSSVEELPAPETETVPVDTAGAGASTADQVRPEPDTSDDAEQVTETTPIGTVVGVADEPLADGVADVLVDAEASSQDGAEVGGGFRGSSADPAAAASLALLPGDPLAPPVGLVA